MIKSAKNAVFSRFSYNFSIFRTMFIFYGKKVHTYFKYKQEQKVEKMKKNKMKKRVSYFRAQKKASEIFVGSNTGVFDKKSSARGKLFFFSDRFFLLTDNGETQKSHFLQGTMDKKMRRPFYFSSYIYFSFFILAVEIQK